MTKSTQTNTTSAAEAYDIKALSDAAAELNRKIAANMAEVGTRTLNDIVGFADMVSAAQRNAVKQYGSYTGAGDAIESMTKLQAQFAKGFTTWAESFQKFGK